jgi:hypothetical protein
LFSWNGARLKTITPNFLPPGESDNKEWSGVSTDIGAARAFHAFEMSSSTDARRREDISGTLFMAVLIARLVALYSSQAPAPAGETSKADTSSDSDKPAS